MVDGEERILADGAKFQDLGAVLSPGKLENNGRHNDLCFLWGEGKGDLLLLSGTQGT